MIFSFNRMRLTILLTAAIALPVAAQARTQDRVGTAAEEARRLTLYPATGLTSDDGRYRIPSDQLDATIALRAKRWVASLQTTPVKGIQLDPMGTLSVAAGQDDVAKRQFSARLATRNLSVADQAYTLLLATSVFGANANDTLRMQAA